MNGLIAFPRRGFKQLSGERDCRRFLPAERAPKKSAEFRPTCTWRYAGLERDAIGGISADKLYPHRTLRPGRSRLFRVWKMLEPLKAHEWSDVVAERPEKRRRRFVSLSLPFLHAQ